MVEFKTNKLKLMALDFIEDPNPPLDREIKKIDITDVYEDELYDKMLRHREAISVSYLSRVRSGKSTINFADGVNIQNSMNRLGFTNTKWSINNVARTQYELSKKLRNNELNNFYIACDEFDDLDDTQANSSIEQALLRHFNKVQAGRYNHLGYCSPRNIPDDNSEIIINIDAINKKKRLTKAFVYYNLLKGTTPYRQFIGYRIIDVSPVISNWVDEGLEKLFYQHGTKAPHLPEMVKWRKKDWYVDYVCRKFEKMTFLNEHGIFQTRDLDYSDIYLEAVTELKPQCKLKGLVTQKLVKNTMKRLFRKYVVPSSIIGDEVMSQRVDGILDYWKQYYELQKRLIHLTMKLRASKIEPTEYVNEKTVLEETMHRMLESAEKEENELHKLSDLKKRFYGV